MRIACIADLGCLLGEGPVWDVQTSALWWVDIKAPAIHRLDPATGRLDRWPAPEVVGALALRRDGGLVLAVRSGFVFYDPDSGVLVPVASPEADMPGNRMNDAKCDPLGRFWAGTMDDAEKAPTGQLYRLGAERAVKRFHAGFVVANGLGWSGDARTFYFTDSTERTLWAYDFDLAAGELGRRRLFAQASPDHGHPDGLCVDADDHVWSAHWNGGRLTRYRPDGAVDRTVELPVPLVTSCCFGGPNLDVLYVTTATIGMTPAARAAHPQAGGVFAIEGLGVHGRPMHRYAG
jgi:sugar lactone lactonase YvrE